MNAHPARRSPWLPTSLVAVAIGAGCSLLSPATAAAQVAPGAPEPPGPSATAATPPTPAPSGSAVAAPTGSRIHFESDTRDTAVYRKTGEIFGAATVWSGHALRTIPTQTNRYEQICAAPCDSTLPDRTYALGMSKGRSDPADSEELVTIRGPSRVSAAYVDRSAGRLVGWLVFAGGLLAGTAMAFKSNYVPDCDDTPGCDPRGARLFYSGIAVVSAATILGLELVLYFHDEVKFTVTPWTTAVASTSAGGGAMERRNATPAGLALHVQF